MLFYPVFIFAEETPVNPKIKDAILERLCPQPKEADFFEGEYLLAPDACVALTTPKAISEAEKSQIKKIFRQYWKFVPDIEFGQKHENEKLGSEGYTIDIDSAITIDGRNLTGLKHALKTLRQLGESSRNSCGFVFQRARIKDFASLKFRGMHLCIFPETKLEQLEKYIRLASYYKFNYVVIEPWGVFPYMSHPQFAYADKKIDRDKFKRLINLCYELDITPIPQVSVLGHATQSRVLTAKHAVLANHPEMENVFELYGWSYCMSSPKADKILKDMLAEIYDFYGKPPFFHIGCDEAYDMGTCYSCRKQNITELLASHLAKFNNFVNSLGARAIIWHDMLLDRADARWKGYVALGDAETAKALEKLPKNIIIADWQYGYKAKEDDPEPTWPTTKFFRKEKFDVLVCPWINEQGTKSLGEFAGKEKLMGMLETTWHIYHGVHYPYVHATAAYAAWNPAVNPMTSLATRLSVAMHMRQIGWDMDVVDYEKTGWNQYQVDPGHHPHPVS